MLNIIHRWRHRFARLYPAQRLSQRTEHGQAMVELALSITFLAFLFSAAVDLGFAYKSYQTLLNATAEASSYLVYQPASSCDSCDPQVAMDASDSIARTRFRSEQGNKIRGFGGSTMDLNADGKDDATTVPAGFGSFDQFIVAMVQVDEADSTQVTTTNSDFAVNNSFNPAATDPLCLQREKFDSNGGQCFIVVRSTIQYRPFAIAPVSGNIMNIRAISVKPIVK